MAITTHSKSAAQRFTGLVRQTRSGKKRSFAIGHAGSRGWLLVSARKPSVAAASLKQMRYPERDTTGPVEAQARSKPQVVASGEITLEGQEVVLKCTRLQGAPAELKKHFISYFRAFGLAPVSTKVTTLKPSDWDAAEFEEDPDAAAVDDGEVVDDTEPEASTPEMPPARAEPADQASEPQPEAAATGIPEVGPDDSPETRAVKEKAAALLAQGQELAVKLAFPNIGDGSKLWAMFQPILNLPPDEQAEMLNVLGAKLTLAMANPGQLTALLGLEVGRKRPSKQVLTKTLATARTDVALLRDAPEGSKLRALLTRAGGVLSVGNADEAADLIEDLQSRIAAANSRARAAEAAAATNGAVSFAKAKLDWRTAEKTLDNTLYAFAAGFPRLEEVRTDPRIADVQAALQSIDTLVPPFGSQLADALDRLDGAADAQERARAQSEAATVIADYKALLQEAAPLQAIDRIARSGMGLAVIAPMQATLDELAAQFA